MGGPQGVSRDPRADWRFHEQPPLGEAQRRQLPLAPWAKDYDKVRSSSPSIGLLVVAPGGEVAFKPAVVARPDASVEREEAAKHARLVAVVHPERRFSDLKALTVEIFRLKSEASKSHEPYIAQALKQQLCMLQSQWVGMAKAADIPEPTGRLDALTAKPEDVARAFMWSEAGGVIPRGEVEADGGRAFQMPASGMTFFGENAFVLGREAFTSDAELTKTLLHETQRLTTSRSSGGVSADVATSETEAAASFAERAHGRYFT